MRSIAARKPRGGGGRSGGGLDLGERARALRGRDLLALVGFDLGEDVSVSIGDRDQPVEPAFGLAGVERLGGERDAFLQVLRLAGDHEGGRRIEQRDVAERALLALEHGGQRRRVGLGIAAAQLLGLGRREPDILRRDLEGRHLAVLQRRDAWSGRRS